MEQSQISAVGATRIVVGLSALIRVQPSPYQFATSIKILSGGGTLEIVPLPIAVSGSSASGWGQGYPIGASEVYTPAPGPAAFYLAASGATMTAALSIGYTNGASLV